MWNKFVLAIGLMIGLSGCSENVDESLVYQRVGNAMNKLNAARNYEQAQFDMISEQINSYALKCLEDAADQFNVEILNLCIADDLKGLKSSGASRGEILKTATFVDNCFHKAIDSMPPSAYVKWR